MSYRVALLHPDLRVYRWLSHILEADTEHSFLLDWLPISLESGAVISARAYDIYLCQSSLSRETLVAFHYPPTAEDSETDGARLVIGSSYEEVLRIFLDLLLRPKLFDRASLGVARLRGQHHRLLIASSTSLFWSCDAEGIVTFVNRAGAQAILNLTPKEIIGQPIDTFFKVEQEVSFFGAISRNQSQNEARLTAYSSSSNEERSKIIEFHYVVHRSTDHHVIGCTGIAVDISSHRESEQDLREIADIISKESRQGLFQRVLREVMQRTNGILGVLVVTTTESQDSFAVVAAESGGQIIAKEELPQFSEVLRKVKESKSNVVVVDWRSRCLINGQIQEFSSCVCIPIRNGEGVFCGAILSCLKERGNISPRIESLLTILGYRVETELETLTVEEALRGSEQRFRSYFHLPLIGATVTSLDTGWVEVNDYLCQMLGYTREELVKLTWIELTHPEDVAKDIALFNRVLSGELDQYNLEKRYIRKDKSILPALISVGVVRNPDGSINYFIALIQDISERISAEQERLRLEGQLQHAQKLESLGVLAGGIAHDFNNLLMGVMGNASLALIDLPQGSSAKESIERVQIAAEQLAELANQMLAYSGRASVVMQPVNIRSAVEDMSSFIRSSISKKIAIDLSFEDELPLVHGDLSQIRQIFLNLLSNSADAIGDSTGEIRVRVFSIVRSKVGQVQHFFGEPTFTGNYVVLEVQDTGSGIAPHTLARMFDPFYTTKFTGRGLGLAVVLGIVRGHQGAIEVESALGGGTVFRVFLPESSLATLQKNTEQATVSESNIALGGTVLVVDDEEAVREVAAQMLIQAGYQVILAENGHEALDVLSTYAVSIRFVLLDLTMPVLGGLETLAAIREQYGKLPVLLSSGYNEEELQTALSESATGFIQKPYQYKDLVQAAQKLLSGVKLVSSGQAVSLGVTPGDPIIH